MFDIFLLLGAGFFGGILNSIAGGGSFITFPALLAVGVAPISANATNTFASCAGYMSGVYAFRQDIYAHRKDLPKIVIVSLLGGLLGGWLLLQTPGVLFQKAIPWLLLFATLLFTFGSRINRRLKKISSHHKHAPMIAYVLLFVMLFGVSIYGGFFNAGLGIVSLSYLALAGYTNINSMNGIKLLISSSVSIVAIVLFIYNGAIAWYEGFLVLLGSLVGGYMAANIFKQLPQHHVRTFVIVVSCSITLYFFNETYSIF